jgi:hypothetical protein
MVCGQRELKGEKISVLSGTTLRKMPSSSKKRTMSGLVFNGKKMKKKATPIILNLKSRWTILPMTSHLSLLILLRKTRWKKLKCFGTILSLV